MNPLEPNCRGLVVDSAGKVVGVKLSYTRVPEGRYELYRVRMRNEYEAQGNTVARCQVLDRNNIDTGIAVRMAWPGHGPHFQDSALPGNPSNEHFISNKYWDEGQGPLSLYVGEHNQPNSDMVHGLGLYKGHHVSFDVIFRERGAQPEPEPTPTPTDPDPVLPPDLFDAVMDFDRYWDELKEKLIGGMASG